MATKKSFKNQSREPVASFFMSGLDTEDMRDTQGTKDMQNIRGIQDTKKLPVYRINLKLKGEYKAYLDRVSWECRKSITQYLNDLIAADMERNQADQL